MVYVACWKNLNIGISVFQFNLEDINNLEFSSISYLLLLNNLFKNENQFFFLLDS